MFAVRARADRPMAPSRGAARVVGGRSPAGRREARRRLRQRQAGLLRGQGKDPHPGDRRRPSVVGQPTLPTAQPAGEAQTRDAATEASVPEPPDRGGGNLSGTDIHGPRFAWIRSPVRYVLVTGPGAVGDARHRDLPGKGHRPSPHHAGTAGPPGRGEAAGRSGARHPDIRHRPGALRRPASEPAATAAGNEKGPAEPREAEPGHPGPRRPRKAEAGMG